ncbi:hypothetical protein [Curvibacter lanceolatus]|jgi:hypothetical protein|uniref:hypothetical protein n=1 Tax=Curvibacter lanceolatus TaxID=86182 RepID=UPI0004CF5F4D|nr:hypothetical protein [Curvibacter lanceolatus]
MKKLHTEEFEEWLLSEKFIARHDLASDDLLSCEKAKSRIEHLDLALRLWREYVAVSNLSSELMARVDVHDYRG